MEKLRKITKHTNIAIIVLIILASTLLIGTPILKSNIHIVYVASGLYSLFYFINKIVTKEKIEISKIDICIWLIAITSIIPLIARTYVSLSGTIETILEYICILSLYTITKNECKKEPKYINVIINTIIISILILCIIRNR